MYESMHPPTSEGEQYEDNLQAIYDGVIDGDMAAVQTNVNAALDAGVAPQTILDDALVKAMAEVGQRFEEGHIFVPEMLVAARAMKAGLTILRPKLVDDNVEPGGTVVIGTVQGDLHDIGKNLVGMMLEGAGFEIIDLGVNVTPATFVEAVTANDADMVALSALLTTTMPNMSKIIDAINQAGVREKVKVIVGGAPVTEDFAAQIGADGYAKDAGQAAVLVGSLLA